MPFPRRVYHQGYEVHRNPSSQRVSPQRSLRCLDASSTQGLPVAERGSSSYLMQEFRNADPTSSNRKTPSESYLYTGTGEDSNSKSKRDQPGEYRYHSSAAGSSKYSSPTSSYRPISSSTSISSPSPPIPITTPTSTRRKQDFYISGIARLPTRQRPQFGERPHVEMEVTSSPLYPSSLSFPDSPHPCPRLRSSSLPLSHDARPKHYRNHARAQVRCR
ncbi:hypothetical protein L218DRAFT_756823 [Marasmius fiardii PR-910]|nr:hypothetical protein L218DRAFT_756823 [Marasmius fiardii PR-910]